MVGAANETMMPLKADPEFAAKRTAVGLEHIASLNNNVGSRHGGGLHKGPGTFDSSVGQGSDGN